MAPVLEETLILEEISVPGYEKVIKIVDEKACLNAIVAIHNTALGPSLGGTRIYPYASFDDALNDALRLARGMTYKSALTELGLGGGKSVIIADPRKDKTPALLTAFGQAIHRLKGAYICAEDYGSSMDDMRIVQQVNPYIVGLSHEKSSGDPAVFTAWGTFRGLQAVLKKLYGSDSVEGKTVAIQGLGAVGYLFAKHLFWAGAKLIIADIDREKVQKIAKELDAQVVAPEEIMSVQCDVLAPCALGATINPHTIPKLRCRAIAGCANNQLLKDSDADELLKRGILYAPDFVINAGGVVNVSCELEAAGYLPSLARKKVEKIYDQLSLIFDVAEQNRSSTHAAAVALGDYRLKYGIGKRQGPIYFHHSNHRL